MTLEQLNKRHLELWDARKAALDNARQHSDRQVKQIARSNLRSPCSRRAMPATFWRYCHS